jgi:hypothetical protein
MAASRPTSNGRAEVPLAAAMRYLAARHALQLAIIGKAVALLSRPAGWPRSCGASSSADGWAARACRWMSGSAGTSRP